MTLSARDRAISEQQDNLGFSIEDCSEQVDMSELRLMTRLVRQPTFITDSYRVSNCGSAMGSARHSAASVASSSFQTARDSCVSEFGDDVGPLPSAASPMTTWAHLPHWLPSQPMQRLSRISSSLGGTRGQEPPAQR